MIHAPAADASITVAQVVDRPPLRARVRMVLADRQIACAAEFDSIAQLTDHPVVTSVDAVVLLAGATRTQTFDSFVRARASLPELPMVGLWPDEQRREDRRALRTGIDALVLESEIESGLAAAVQAVCLGLVCLPRTGARCATDTLSNREKQVLGMLIMGFTNAEIGRRLYLAESTVKSHLSAAYTKIGVRSRKDAAAVILDPDEGLGTDILAIAPARARPIRTPELSAVSSS